MKKYGILSLNIYEKDNNWGSILQSYALQELVKEMGYDVLIVDIHPSYIKKNEARYPFKKNFPFHIRRLFHSFNNDFINAKTYVQRDNEFRRFITSYYQKTPNLMIDQLANEHFDGFIVGSDIVWNIEFTKGFNDLYFCNYPFMRKTNNIAYAPSMSDETYSKKEEAKFATLLNNFTSISVREKSKAKYVERFAKKRVDSVLDPTLLLPQNHYLKFLQENLIAKPYILVYTVPSDEALAQYVAEYAVKNGYELVRVECLDIKEKKYKCIEKNNIGIEDWLTLIKNASIIVTNSFHACIFSIIFNKQFHAVYRNPGKTKIHDLLSELNIDNHYEKTSCYRFDISKEIDYSSVNKRLECLISKSKNYLSEALSKEDFSLHE